MWKLDKGSVSGITTAAYVAALSWAFERYDTGTPASTIPNKLNFWFEFYNAESGHGRIPEMLWNNDYLTIYGSVATDHNHILAIDVRLRSEQ